MLFPFLCFIPFSYLFDFDSYFDIASCMHYSLCRDWISNRRMHVRMCGWVKREFSFHSCTRNYKANQPLNHASSIYTNREHRRDGESEHGIFSSVARSFHHCEHVLYPSSTVYIHTNPSHTQANVSFDYTPKNRWMGTSFALITRIVVFNIFSYACIFFL